MSVSFFSYIASLHFHIRIRLIIYFYLVDLVCFSLYLIISHWCWVLLFLFLILVVFVVILYSLWYSIFLLCWLVISDLIELLLHEWHINCYDKVVVMKPIYVFELLLEKISSIYIYSYTDMIFYRWMQVSVLHYKVLFSFANDGSPLSSTRLLAYCGR